MIAIDTSGVAQFERELAVAWLGFEDKISKKFEDFTRDVFKMIVQNSPQWSSNLAGNWNYSVNGPNGSYTRSELKTGAPYNNKKPFERGAEPVVSRTIARMKLVPGPSWRDTVYITNATPSDEGSFLVDEMESGRVSLRPVNLIQGQVALFNYTVAIRQDEIL